MKRFLLWVLLVFTGSALFIRAADSLSEAAAFAAQKDAEERYRRLAADVQTVLDTQEVLLKRQEDTRQRLDKLAEEIRTLKEDQSRASGNFASRDELRKYVEKMKELDDKREADKRLILENIKELGKLPLAATASVEKPPARHGSPEPTNEEPPYVYVVKKNDRLLDIIAEYNDHFQKTGKPKISLEQVLKANPGLKPDHLVAGRKLRIPVPAKDSK